MSKLIRLTYATVFQQVRAKTDVSYATFNRRWKDMKMAEEIKEAESHKWVLV
jgi:hypothetical protein